MGDTFPTSMAPPGASATPFAVRKAAALLVLACALSLGVSASQGARAMPRFAGTCGIPATSPLWIDFGGTPGADHALGREAEEAEEVPEVDSPLDHEDR